MAEQDMDGAHGGAKPPRTRTLVSVPGLHSDLQAVPPRRTRRVVHQSGVVVCPAEQLAPGQMINESVRLLEELGRGGMGSVWTAEHLRLEARVAVKFIDPDLVRHTPSLRTRFQREASIGARLRSIHAVQAFDQGETSAGTPFIVMELLDGETLTDRIERDGPLSLGQATHVVAQIAKVLHRAHVLSVVHRDIKPDNLFLLEDEDYELFVKVLDFGIAKERSPSRNLDMTAQGFVVGTPEFMSPEQWIGRKDLDHRSDLYSLGIVTFYALTGELPFDEDDPERPFWMQQAQGDLRTLRSFLPAASEALEGWMRRALAPEPEDRFNSAKEMARALILCANADGLEVVDELSSAEGSGCVPAAPPSGTLDGFVETSETPDRDSREIIGAGYEHESTTVMDEDALRRALEDEDQEDEPPTQRRPRPSLPSAPLLDVEGGSRSSIALDTHAPLVAYAAVVALVLALVTTLLLWSHLLPR